jgi:hypothetical protein
LYSSSITRTIKEDEVDKELYIHTREIKMYTKYYKDLRSCPVLGFGVSGAKHQVLLLQYKLDELCIVTGSKYE